MIVCSVFGALTCVIDHVRSADKVSCSRGSVVRCDTARSPELAQQTAYGRVRAQCFEKISSRDSSEISDDVSGIVDRLSPAPKAIVPVEPTKTIIEFSREKCNAGGKNTSKKS